MSTTSTTSIKRRGRAFMREPLTLRRPDIIPVRFDWKRIVREIEATGLKQGEIGAAVGCDQSAISLIKTGATREPLAGVGLRLLVLHDQRVTHKAT